STSGVVYRNPGDLSSQSAKYIFTSHAIDIHTIYFPHRISQRFLFPSDAQRGDDDFFQSLCAFHQDDVDRGLSVNSHLEGGESNVGKYQHIIGFGFYLVLTVDVSGCSGIAVLDSYGHSRKRTTILGRSDRSADSDGLWIQEWRGPNPCRKEGDQKAEKQAAK